MEKKAKMTLEEFKKASRKVLEDNIKVMKIARDVIWPTLEGCESILEAQNLMQAVGQTIESAYYNKKGDTKIKELDCSILTDKAKKIVDKIKNNSVREAESAFNSLGQMIDSQLKNELKDRKFAELDKSKIFYLDDSIFDQKRAEIDKTAEEQYAKMESVDSK